MLRTLVWTAATAAAFAAGQAAAERGAPAECPHDSRHPKCREAWNLGFAGGPTAFEDEDTRDPYVDDLGQHTGRELPELDYAMSAPFRPRPRAVDIACLDDLPDDQRCEIIAAMLED